MIQTRSEGKKKSDEFNEAGNNMMGGDGSVDCLT